MLDFYVKDLRILNRDLKKVFIVDDMVLSFGQNYNNGIPIIPFLTNKKDIELLMLKKYLEYLLLFDEPLKTNKKYF